MANKKKSKGRIDWSSYVGEVEGRGRGRSVCKGEGEGGEDGLIEEELGRHHIDH